MQISDVKMSIYLIYAAIAEQERKKTLLTVSPTLMMATK